jgi:hypothetical protein
MFDTRQRASVRNLVNYCALALALSTVVVIVIGSMIK